ncbi:MAG TPA: TIGR04255 family protein [Chloroflexota bacterium]|nr:TIGR04255 family protein [Chloroflexota bacterium]
MALPEYGRVVFAKSPLRLVVGQVRFPIMLRFGESGFLAPFHQALRSEYPHIARENQVTLALSPKGLQQGIGAELMRFSTRDGRLSVVVGETAITLEAQRRSPEEPFGYLTADDFLGRFEHVLSVAQETLGITERARVGLRYVNEVRHPEAASLEEWGRLLNPSFVGFAATDLLEGEVSHVLQEVQIQRSDGILAIRHGLLTGAVVDASAAETRAAGPFYLIDMDYFDPSERPLEVQSTVSQMRAFNDTMYRFFRWTLGDALYNHLEPSRAD